MAKGGHLLADSIADGEKSFYMLSILGFFPSSAIPPLIRVGLVWLI